MSSATNSDRDPDHRSSKERRSRWGGKAREDTPDTPEPPVEQESKKSIPQFQRERDLPIHACKQELLDLIAQNQFLVVTGDTGSGKSTQLAQFLYEAGYSDRGVIAISQPRRVGAVSVSRRVAQEMGVELGEEVGYTIRFEDCTSPRTRVRFMTDGCLLRECLEHKNLEPYSVVVLDEAHERSLQTDVLFGLVRRMAKRRPDIKFIITSATLDQQQFSIFFNNCPTFHVPGRCFPVDIIYNEGRNNPNYVDLAVNYALRIHSQLPLGDILVFLTGEDEIQKACQKLGDKVDALVEDGHDPPDIVILPVYAALPPAQQQAVFAKAPANCRKVLFSTNICETSLTVDGIVYVIDSGYVKQRIFNPNTGMDSLLVVPISQVAATQRTGRAGRTQAGQCYRLYTEETYNKMPLYTIPEIQRTHLSHTVLLLKEYGVDDPLTFELLDRPSRDNIIEALLELYYLEALDDNGKLTELGARMSHFPVSPAFAKLLLLSVRYGCQTEMLTIVAMLTAENLYERPSSKDEIELAEAKHRMFWSEFGDPITLLCLYDAWLASGRSNDWCKQNYIQARALERARSTREQLETTLQRFSKRVESTAREDECVELACKVIAETFFFHAARRAPPSSSSSSMAAKSKASSSTADFRYKTLKESDGWVFIHPSSPCAQTHPKWVVYTEIVYTSKPFMKNVCSIQYEWIERISSRLRTANIQKLTGRDRHDLLEEQPKNQAQDSKESHDDQESKQTESELKKRKNTETDVDAARRRYLERKKSRT